MILQAIILGIVQGLTEFLPVSSSAHLLLVPYFLKWQDPGLAFDVALHWGTLAAVLLVFGKDYWKFFSAFLVSIFGKGKISSEDARARDAKMAWYLILGSIPAALFGVLLQDKAETVFRDPIITVFTLSGFALFLWLADAKGRHAQGLDSVGWGKSLAMGLAQAVAIIPGVSRSGATMTAGLLSGLDRKSAARFSFLLSGPIIFGAGLVASRHAIFNLPLAAGFLAALISGVAAIKFLLRYLESGNFNLFVWYRIILSAVILLLVLVLR